MLLAFDQVHDAGGQARPEASAFHVPNAYARTVAARYPNEIEWAASVHPYRADAVEALDAAVAGGALAVKWLPNAMGIDPASPRCDPLLPGARPATASPCSRTAGGSARSVAQATTPSGTRSGCGVPSTTGSGSSSRTAHRSEPGSISTPVPAVRSCPTSTSSRD